MTSEVLNHMMPTNITKVNIRNGTIKPTDKLLSSSFAINNFLQFRSRGEIKSFQCSFGQVKKDHSKSCRVKGVISVDLMSQPSGGIIQGQPRCSDRVGLQNFFRDPPSQVATQTKVSYQIIVIHRIELQTTIHIY